MTPTNEKIEVAKITSKQAVLVAAITAVAGVATGYFATNPRSSPEADASIQKLNEQLQERQVELGEARSETLQAENELRTLKQRVRDILGPKEFAIRDMSNSLERMKGDAGVSQHHRERLSTMVGQLNEIDNIVLQLVE